MLNIRNKNIIIKTYLFESGLFYLGLSLCRELSKNNNVFLFPKERYEKSGGVFRPHYKSPSSRDLLNNFNCILFKEYKKSNLIKSCRSNKIDIIISLESFMPNSSWIKDSKTMGVKVIDVPMPEWTSERHISNGSYSLFDEIWCLTDTAYNLFNQYKSKVKISWDYANGAIFNPKIKREIGTFYHAASLNPSFSQKNTTKVIESFLDFEVNKNVKLIITGSLSVKQKVLAKKSNNIMIINEILDKEEIYNLYQKSHCLIAPSEREGLGLHFYEAEKMGCKIITTNCDPMDGHGPYLCDVISYNKGVDPVPFAVVSKEEIIKQLNIFYKEEINVK
jgi:glycosyltransferase involved in cell wall biosynthesis